MKTPRVFVWMLFALVSAGCIQPMPTMQASTTLTEPAASSVTSDIVEPHVAPVHKPINLEALYALINDGVYGTDTKETPCNYSADKKKLPRNALVIMVNKATCVAVFTIERQLVEILYDGKPYYVFESDIKTTPERMSSLATRSQADIHFNRQNWAVKSKQMTLAQKSQVIDKLNKSKSQGVAVISSSIFDVSEYTEATGFRITVYNSGNKTIKYITVSLHGLNAVGDPVSNRFHRSQIVSIRGIGPIKPEDTGTYSKEFMWMTDIVQTFDIDSIELEFMDGTSRTISRKQLTWLTPSERETLLGD